MTRGARRRDRARLRALRQHRGDPGPAIEMYGRGKVQTLHLVVPFKEKRNSDGGHQKESPHITAADLVSNGRTTSTFAASPAGKTSRHLTQLELGRSSARTAHKDVWGIEGALTWKAARGRLGWGGARSTHPSARMGRARHLPQALLRRGPGVALRIVGNMPGLQNAGGRATEADQRERQGNFGLAVSFLELKARAMN